MNVTTDVPKLGAALQINENIQDMDIVQYLTYVSKQACNYKRTMAAIKQCCENVNVDFYLVNMILVFSSKERGQCCDYSQSAISLHRIQGDDDFLEGVQVPLREIFLRLPASGDLKRILTIRNKRFHQMNVLGESIQLSD